MSRFTTIADEDDQQILRKVLSSLPSDIVREVDKSKFEKVELFEGEIEFLIKNSTGRLIATASVSEFNQGIFYWSVYRIN